MFFEPPLTARQIGERCGVSISGDPEIQVNSVSALSDARPGTLSFLSERGLIQELNRLRQVVVFTRPEWITPNDGVAFVPAADPRRLFFEFLAEMDPVKHWRMSDAAVDSSVRIPSSARLGRDVHIGANTVLGEGVLIHDSVTLGRGVTIGDFTEIFPRVVILDRVQIGSKVKILSGTVIGGPGFGFLPTAGGYEEIPQIGSVRIENDVRIGSNCTVDRGTLGDTVIGAGSKLDNLVHVGHNCSIGKNCILCAQVGLGGSTILEDDVVLGGQVGLGDHVRVGRGARMGGQSGSSTDIRGGETYFLTPAVPIRDVKRLVRAWRHLPKLFQRVLTLEKGTEAL